MQQFAVRLTSAPLATAECIQWTETATNDHPGHFPLGCTDTVDIQYSSSAMDTFPNNDSDLKSDSLMYRKPFGGFCRNGEIWSRQQARDTKRIVKFCITAAVLQNKLSTN